MWTVGLGKLAACVKSTVLRTAIFRWNVQWLLQSDSIG